MHSFVDLVRASNMPHTIGPGVTRCQIIILAAIIEQQLVSGTSSSTKVDMNIEHTTWASPDHGPCGLTLSTDATGDILQQPGKM